MKSDWPGWGDFISNIQNENMAVSKSHNTREMKIRALDESADVWARWRCDYFHLLVGSLWGEFNRAVYECF